MAEQTFKSPNFYEREIDKSAPSATGPSGVPAAVIGTANKGPAFVPVTVSNFSELSTVFGNLDTQKLGLYAANEFLKHKSALTYLRVLGAGANSTDGELSNTQTYGVTKNAGFVLTGSAAASNDLRQTGTTQFLVAKHIRTTNGSVGMPMFEDNTTMGSSDYVNLVRGMVMVPNTARVMIQTSSALVTAVDNSLEDTTLAAADSKFKIIISSSLGSTFGTVDAVAGVRVLTASFDPSSKDYFAKVLNTDPDKFYQDQHYLHADFAVDPNVAYVSSSCPVGILSGSGNFSANSMTTRPYRDIFSSFDARFQAPQTTYFISQPFGATEYDLFKFEALDDGEYANSLYKISIANVRASLDDSNKYGTFTVQIRDWNDTDTTPNVLEQFNNCSLDPTSPNYVARLIGDRKLFFNFDAVNTTEKRLVATGKYPNNSRYVRIVMNDQVEKKVLPPECLPFGFHGPAVLNVNPNTLVATALSSANSRLGGQMGSNQMLSSSFVPPVPYRYKVTRGEVNTSMAFNGEPGASEQANVSYYWGVKFERSSTSSTPEDTDILAANAPSEKNACVKAFTKFVGIKLLDALVTGSNADALHDNKFTLAKVALYNTAVNDLTASVNAHMRQAAYVRNASLDSSDYTWTESSRRRLTMASLLASGSAPVFNRFSAYNKFTTFMAGGFDGTNFLNRDARRLNDKSVSFDSGGGASASNDIAGFPTNSNPSGQNTKNNGVASYLAAAELATNPMEANNNILVLPGIREPYIVETVMQSAKKYGMTYYVADIPSYDDSGNRLYDDSTARPSINQTTKLFDSRALDNNFVGTYYPDVYIDDTVNRRKVKVPASVAALGALAYNDRVAYPWFAPAGFNRAALDFVSNVDVRLSVPDRDRLYESRINPIASFPRLGYVIYGQKTLQINKSALDRVNVRRLLLEIKRIITGIAQRMVFEQNTPVVRNKFVADASLQLGLIQAQAGIEAFQVVMNESNNTPQDVELNKLNGRIVVVPTRVVEFIAIDFVITNSGVEFV